MKKYLHLFTTVILCFSLPFCKSEKRQDLLENSKTQKSGELLPDLTSIAEVDSIFTPNAPAGITRKVRQDKEGQLLIAAFTDVMIFNGNSFSKVPKPEGHESYDAFDALEDREGNIWIASTHYGVFRFDGENFTHFTTDNGLAHNRTMDIYEDSKGNIWIATMGGVSCYNGVSFQNYTTKEGMSHNDVNVIIEDRNGKIWFGTREKACFYEPASATFTEITHNEDEPLSNVRSIIEDRKGTIWLSSREGIWRYDSSRLMRVSSSRGNSMYEDKNGNIWFTHENVLSVINKGSTKPRNSKATEVFTGKGMFFGISEDKEGSIWVGTLQGVFKYDGRSVHYYRDVGL